MPHFGHVLVLATVEVMGAVIDVVATSSRSGIGLRITYSPVTGVVAGVVAGVVTGVVAGVVAGVSAGSGAGASADMHSVSDVKSKDPGNTSCLVSVALEFSQAAPHSFWLNDTASENMYQKLTTCDTSHFEMSLLNDFAFENISDMDVTFDTSHFERSLLKEVASINTASISVTLDTCHSDMSLLNDDAS